MKKKKEKNCGDPMDKLLVEAAIRLVIVSFAPLFFFFRPILRMEAQPMVQSLVLLEDIRPIITIGMYP